MAIIYSYQENEDLLNSDMLVGTATTLHNGKVRKITKNFTLGQLKTFINTGDLILSNGGTSGPATLIDNILNIPVYQGQITLTTTGSSGAATLIGNTLNIPQYGGTPPTPTLQQVTTAGNTTSNSVIVSNGTGSLVTVSNNGIFFQTSTSHGVIFSNSGFSLVDDLTTQQFGLDFDGLYLKTISGGSGGRIKADLLTSTQRTYQLPDASGTIALTSDIPVITTPTLQQVTTAGNTTTDAVTLGTTTIKQSTGTSVAIFKDNTNATVGTISEFGSLNFIGGSHTFGATGNAEIIAGTYRTGNYGDGFKDAANNVNFVASLNTGFTFGWSSKGTIEYAADYSANFGNRTLVDKAYVLSVLPATITLTTTGSGGASTLIGNTLNIPQYMGASTRKNANNSTNSNINYCGVALGTGVSESSAVWTITRLTIASSGSVTIGTATNVAWTNRESVIYT